MEAGLTPVQLASRDAPALMLENALVSTTQVQIRRAQMYGLRTQPGPRQQSVSLPQRAQIREITAVASTEVEPTTTEWGPEVGVMNAGTETRDKEICVL